MSNRPTESRWAGGDLRPGDFTRATDGTVIHRCAGCGRCMCLRLHHVHEESNRAAHISGPAAGSVLCPHAGCGAHYFVHHGVIEWC